MTFGIKPTRPETGYGYIQPNRRNRLMTKGRLTGHPVARFVEKPHADEGGAVPRSGNYYWNSGMFLWKAATILQEIKRHQPLLARVMPEIHRMIVSGAAAGHH